MLSTSKIVLVCFDLCSQALHHACVSFLQATQLKQRIQNTLVKIDDLGIFKIIDVAGDGNCFFNALVNSQHTRITSPSVLRRFLCDAMEDEEKPG